MNYNASYRGKVYKSTLATSSLYSSFYDGLFHSAYATEHNGKPLSVRVILTGFNATSKKGNTGWLTTDGDYIILSEGWEEQQYNTSVPTYSDSEAQALVRRIINNNITILQNNLVCARYANKFSDEQRTEIMLLQSRLDARNSAIKGSSLCENIVTSYPKGYAELGGYLQALMQGESIGAIATWAFVVIAATIIAGMGTAAYIIYKSYYNESENDVKYSKKLMAILAKKLTPEEYEQLKRETQGIVTRAKIRKAASGFGTGFLLAAGIVGGAFLYRYLKNK